MQIVFIPKVFAPFDGPSLDFGCKALSGRHIVNDRPIRGIRGLGGIGPNQHRDRNPAVRKRSDHVLHRLLEGADRAAERALLALGDDACWNEGAIVLSHSFGEGLLARMIKDEARARAVFETARAHQEKIVQAQPDYGPALCILAMIDASLGRKELALEEGRRAIELMPVEKDATNGSRVLQYFAITAAWAGDKELALQQLQAGLRAPVASILLSYGELKLMPFWDPLRGDPRFEKIVASVTPKDRSEH